MPLSFPTTPTTGDAYTYLGKVWTWNGTVWQANNTPAGPTGPTGSLGPTGPIGPNGVYVESDTAPVSPAAGTAWFNTTDATLYIYYANTWVETTPNLQGATGPTGATVVGPTGPTGAKGSYSASDIAPSTPTTGDAWFSTTDGRLYIYYGGLWIEPNSNLIGPTGPQGATGATGVAGPGSTITATTNTSVPLTFQGTVSQVGDLTDWKNSSGSLIGQVMADGSHTFSNMQFAGKNAVINGAFDIWNRAATPSAPSIPSTTGRIFSADRWNTWRGSAQAGLTITRQVSPTPGVQYCARIQRNSGDTQTGEIFFDQDFETSNSIPFAGQTVTVSFYARLGGNYSAAASQLRFRLVSGLGVDGNVYAGFTGQATPIDQYATLTTTMQRFTYTVTLGSSVTQLATLFSYNPTGTAGANDYFEIERVQFEYGSVATPYSKAGGNLPGELQLCKRFYQRYWGGVGCSLIGIANSTSGILIGFTLPVEMRSVPTPGGSGQIIVSDQYVADIVASSVTVSSPQGVNSTGGRFSLGGYTGLTVGRFYSTPAASIGSGYIDFASEL
jgi:hypothetical protein